MVGWAPSQTLPVVLVALAAAVCLLSPVGAQCGAGLTQCPNPGGGCTANCQGGYDCGASTANCACPYTGTTPTVNGGTYQCFNPSTPQMGAVTVYAGCPGGAQPGNSNLVNYNTAAEANAHLQGAVGACKPVAATRGDPLVQGFDGCSWYMKGQPGQVLNLLSESKHSINTQLVAANLTDADHPDGGTFHGEISLRYQDSVAIASVTPDGQMKVTLGGLAVPFETTRDKSGLRVKVSQYLPYYGQAAEITTPGFKFFIHAVQPYNTPAGHSRGHLDLEATVVTSSPQLHGLLGQSFSRIGAACSEDWDFHGEGVEVDYVMGDLTAVDFKYGLFGRQVSSTRKLQGSDSVYTQGTSEVTAVSRGMY